MHARLLGALTFLPLAGAFAPTDHSFTHKEGAIFAGHDIIPPQDILLADAKALCLKTAGCKGLTFNA